MAKKSTTKKTKTARKSRSSAKKVEKTPNYMVQLGDPMVLRKDLLESLREVIIFMQGYEKFRAMQEDKVTLFTNLQSNLKELHNLIDVKLRKLLPKGNLTAVTGKQQLESFKSEEPEMVESKVKVVPVASQKPLPPVEKEVAAAEDDINALESQLKDIESQLQNLK